MPIEPPRIAHCRQAGCRGEAQSEQRLPCRQFSNQSAGLFNLFFCRIDDDKANITKVFLPNFFSFENCRHSNDTL